MVKLQTVNLSDMGSNPIDRPNSYQDNPMNKVNLNFQFKDGISPKDADHLVAKLQEVIGGAKFSMGAELLPDGENWTIKSISQVKSDLH